MRNDDFEHLLAEKYDYTLVDEESEEVTVLRAVYKSDFKCPWFSYINVKHAKRLLDTTSGLEVKATFVIHNGRCCFLTEDMRHLSLSRVDVTFECPSCTSEHVMYGNPARRQHKRGLLCERCYKSHFYPTLEYQAHYTATMQSRHGVKRPLQSPVIQAKFVETCRRNHGVNYPMMSLRVQKRYQDSMFVTYGRTNWFEGMNAHVEWPREYGFSSIEENFALAFTSHFNNEKIYSCLNRQFFVSDTTEGWCYSLDVYFPNRNVAVEVYGDYWHANPDTYPNDRLLHSGKTARCIREANDVRLERIERKLRCRVLVTWESSLRANFDEEVSRLVKMAKNG